MNLKYITLALIAMMGLFFFACNDDEADTRLSNEESSEVERQETSSVDFVVAELSSSGDIGYYFTQEDLNELCELMSSDLEDVEDASVKFFPEAVDNEGEPIEEFYGIVGKADGGSTSFAIPLETDDNNSMMIMDSKCQHTCTLSQSCPFSSCEVSTVNPCVGHSCIGGCPNGGCNSSVVIENGVQSEPIILTFFVTKQLADPLYY